MSVSKQDWKDYQSDRWLGDVKPALDELNGVFDAVAAAIEGGDVGEFLACTEDDGKLMTAATKAWQAASSAGDRLRELRLEGTQRRFANKNAITVSEAAVAGVRTYADACAILMNGFVRGVRLEHDEVAQDAGSMAAIKSGDLKSRLEDERAGVQGSYDHATDKVAELAAVEKIGIV